MLYGLIAAIFIIVNLSGLLLIKFVLPWQGMRTMRKFRVHPKSRHILPLLRLMGQLVVSISGSVTKGIPIVTDIVPAGIAPSKLMTFAASAEDGIRHPLAEAIMEWADEKKLSLFKSAAINSIPGEGVEALINHQEIRVGTAAFLQNHDVKIPAEILTRADQLAGKGNIISFVSMGSVCRGFIVFTDQIRPTVQGAVNTLEEYGISTTIMTSTAGSTARNIGRQTNIPIIKADLSPMEKAKEFIVLKTSDSLVGAIATTKNSNVLAQCADISFSLSVSEDAIKEKSDVHIDSVDFGNVLLAVDIARYTHGKRNKGLIIMVLFNLILGAITSYLVSLEAMPFFAPILPILIGALAIIATLANQITFKY
ncbi:MAG: HAD family hydrolase [Anaerovibrio sp.]|nr:HAD family hydrolase [Anaerovibrio sp.]